MIHNYKDKHPSLDQTSHVFEGAQVIGDVSIGKNVSVWFNAVIRGDMDKVVIGDNTNIQDGTIIHTNTDMPTIIGRDVTVGHAAIIHAATVEDEALIGMGSIILDQAVIGKNALIAAGAVVPPGKKIPAKSLVVGNPMKIVRELSDEDIEAIKANKDTYVHLLRDYT